MAPKLLYNIAADTILVTHALFVLFVVSGLIFIFVGGALSWRWIRNPWFRVAHLIGIGVVILQSWFGVICPLTTWEMKLREKAGEAIYDGTFITHWLSELLYYEAPPWVFTLCYTVFGSLVLLSWFLVRPRSFSPPIEGGAS